MRSGRINLQLTKRREVATPVIDEALSLGIDNSIGAVAFLDGRLDNGGLLIARLAALVPKPRAHLTRYHGVFAPACPDRP